MRSLPIAALIAMSMQSEIGPYNEFTMPSHWRQPRKPYEPNQHDNDRIAAAEAKRARKRKARMK